MISPLIHKARYLVPGIMCNGRSKTLYLDSTISVKENVEVYVTPTNDFADKTYSFKKLGLDEAFLHILFLVF